MASVAHGTFRIPFAAHGTPCGGRDDWPHRCRTTLPGSQTAMVPAVHPTPPAESGHNSSKTPETRHPQLPAWTGRRKGVLVARASPLNLPRTKRCGADPLRTSSRNTLFWKPAHDFAILEGNRFVVRASNSKSANELWESNPTSFQSVRWFQICS